MSNDIITRNDKIVNLISDVIQNAENEGITLRVFGGVGIYIHCPNNRNYFQKFGRTFPDIDLIGLSDQVKETANFFESSNFEEDKNIRRLSGGQRRNYYHKENLISIDLIFDKLIFCQELDLEERLKEDFPTISITNLFLSKIQKINFDDKDVFDIFIILLEHNVNQNDNELINLDYVAKICSNSWRWWKTLNINIEKLYNEQSIFSAHKEIIVQKLQEIQDAINNVQKSTIWTLRNYIGERMSWYTCVENV